jgi:lipoic acid synthetase
VPKGSPLPPDQDEPDKLARAVVELALKHAVITSVTRDDLPDGGAGQFAACIEKVRELSPDITVEVLVPDFNGNRDALSKVLEARADVFNHNIETVPRLYTAVRPGASYRRSLTMLGAAAQAECSMVKSGIMVGLGETAEEVAAVFTDLVAAGVAAVTVGQYLSPSPQHLPVTEYIHPNQFRRYEELAYAAGFRQVASGPLVRSSYHAAQMIALDT